MNRNQIQKESRIIYHELDIFKSEMQEILKILEDLQQQLLGSLSQGDDHASTPGERSTSRDN